MKMIKDYLFYTSTNDFPIITTGEFFSYTGGRLPQRISKY